MNKKETRKKYIEIRKNIDEKLRDKESRAIVEKIKENIDENVYDAILLYAPLDYEVDVFPLFKNLANERAIQFCFPKVNKDDMDFFFVNSEKELEEGSFNVREPKENCLLFTPKKDGKYLIIVPGVCFDKEGFRIGYGKGYYDKYLSKYEGIKFTKIGVCFKECFIEEIEHDEYDIPVDFVYAR